MIEALNKKEDFRKYLLSTTKLGNIVQEEIDLQVTGGRMNDAIIRISNQLNPYYKNFIRSQNAIEFFFFLETNQHTTGKILLLLIQTLGVEMLTYKED